MNKKTIIASKQANECIAQGFTYELYVDWVASIPSDRFQIVPVSYIRWLLLGGKHTSSQLELAFDVVFF